MLAETYDSFLIAALSLLNTLLKLGVDFPEIQAPILNTAKLFQKKQVENILELIMQKN